MKLPDNLVLNLNAWEAGILFGLALRARGDVSGPVAAIDPLLEKLRALADQLHADAEEVCAPGAGA